MMYKKVNKFGDIPPTYKMFPVPPRGTCCSMHVKSYPVSLFL